MTPWERPFKDTRTPLSSLALAFNACLLDATFELLQRLRCRFGKNRMEKGIGAKRAGQILLGFVLRVERMVDHTRMIYHSLHAKNKTKEYLARALSTKLSAFSIASRA